MEVTMNLPQKKTSEKVTAAKDDTISSVIKKLGFDLDTVVVLYKEKPLPETTIYKEKPLPETTTITEDMELTILEITSKG